MTFITKAQRQALFRKWCQDDNGMSYREFRRTVQHHGDFIIVQWCNMWLGIELDGYAHT
jgi:hypothetical protein